MKLKTLGLLAAGIAACVMLAAGCGPKSVLKDWVATGGSRSDATVELSFDLGPNETPITNEQQGLQMALKRCRSWGYQDVEPFGGVKRVCSEMGTDYVWGGSTCVRYMVTKEYQCIGQGTETPAPAGQ